MATRRSRVGQELHSVVLVRQVSDRNHVGDHDSLVVGDVAGERVCVGRGTTGIKGGEQHSALEHELVRIGRSGKAGEPAFDHMQGE